MIKLGILGAGRIAKVHVETIISNIKEARITRIFDPFMNDETKKWAQDLDIKIDADHAEMLKDTDIDAVLICSPTDTHAAMIMACAEHKKHIFCEKPIDLDLKRIEKVLAVVKKENVIFQVGFNRRFDKNFNSLKEQISEPSFGKIHSIKITSRDPSLPPLGYIKSSGGLFLDMTIHDFDMARFLVGSEIDTIYAQGHCFIDEKVAAAGDIDTAMILLRFKNGVLVTIDNSRESGYGYDQRIEVFGDGGAILAHNKLESELQVMNKNGMTQSRPLDFFLERYSQAYSSEMKEFVDCIVNKKAPTCTGQDGLLAVAIGLAAQKSLSLNQPVKLDTFYTV